ncbi:hypothetical protein HYT02_02555 [Candidatus Gottesmanbacteria bacterium]|nr:hypothetical protein [Candidatus Gottesmanbacteria bacterium]
MFTKHVTVLLDKETHSMLVAIAKRENTTISALIREAIDSMFKRGKKINKNSR